MIIDGLDAFVPTNDYVFKRIFGRVGNEMQMINQDCLEERLMFYWSKMYVGNIRKGENYDVLKKCIGILIANFELHHLNTITKGHTKWKLREKDFS